MRESLERAYRGILEEWNIPNNDSAEQAKIVLVIKNALRDFAESCDRPALWGYCNHMEVMMTDFIFELRNVKHIITRKQKVSNKYGYQVIGEDEVCKHEIDGVIISSFAHKENIKARIKSKYPQLRYLDIYDELEAQGINCLGAYYYRSLPSKHFWRISTLVCGLETCADPEEKASSYEEIVKTCIRIKDFPTAIHFMERYLDLDSSDRNQKRIGHLRDIYDMQMKAVMRISENNVVALCIDGLRRKDLSDTLMPKLYHYVNEHMLNFNHAYSISTYTFESMVPALTENMDMRSKYYQKSQIRGEDCRSISEAVKQGRNIYIYSGVIINDPNVKKMDISLRASSEKLWDFILDAAEEENGLFYLHLESESHYPFAHPYTKPELIISSERDYNDFTIMNDGKIRKDHYLHRSGALRYLDGLLTPVIERLNVGMVLFADHGTDYDAYAMIRYLSDVPFPMFCFGNDRTEIALAIKGPGQTTGQDETPVSLLELNNMLISLMRKEAYHAPKDQVLRVQRSQIYNPDINYVYQKVGAQKALMAFEVFIFELKYKLVIYADGSKELYDIDDVLLSDADKMDELYQKIQDRVTVL